MKIFSSSERMDEPVVLILAAIHRAFWTMGLTEEVSKVAVMLVDVVGFEDVNRGFRLGVADVGTT